MSLLKKVAAQLPIRLQTEIKRILYQRQIRKGTFETNEPEFKILHELVKPRDWVIDIGANVGHYTKRLSELVGQQGRVIAFEPVPLTFSLLSANVELFANYNVTLINAAVSDHLDVVGMSMPKFSSGLMNYYEAHLLTDSDNSPFSVLTMPIDSFCINQRIALVKIDAEGHEAFVLGGMRKLIEASHPILIVETYSNEVIAGLTGMGYSAERLEKSPNVLFRFKSG